MGFISKFRIACANRNLFQSPCTRQAALTLWISQEQNRHFANVIDDICNNKSSLLLRQLNLSIEGGTSYVATTNTAESIAHCAVTHPSNPQKQLSCWHYPYSNCTPQKLLVSSRMSSCIPDIEKMGVCKLHTLGKNRKTFLSKLHTHVNRTHEM